LVFDDMDQLLEADETTTVDYTGTASSSSFHFTTRRQSRLDPVQLFSPLSSTPTPLPPLTPHPSLTTTCLLDPATTSLLQPAISPLDLATTSLLQPAI